jgi:predicted DNA-binding transcriptional regulator AlpA
MKEKKSTAWPFGLVEFEKLPDSAHVSVAVVGALFGCSTPTVWRRVRNGQLVAPHRIGLRTTRWSVGDLRAALANVKGGETC